MRGSVVLILLNLNNKNIIILITYYIHWETSPTTIKDTTTSNIFIHTSKMGRVSCSSTHRQYKLVNAMIKPPTFWLSTCPRYQCLAGILYIHKSSAKKYGCTACPFGSSVYSTPASKAKNTFQNNWVCMFWPLSWLSLVFKALSCMGLTPVSAPGLCT